MRNGGKVTFCPGGRVPRYYYYCCQMNGWQEHYSSTLMIYSTQSNWVILILEDKRRDEQLFVLESDVHVNSTGWEYEEKCHFEKYNVTFAWLDYWTEPGAVFQVTVGKSQSSVKNKDVLIRIFVVCLSLFITYCICKTIPIQWLFLLTLSFLHAEAAETFYTLKQ